MHAVMVEADCRRLACWLYSESPTAHSRQKHSESTTPQHALLNTERGRIAIHNNMASSCVRFVRRREVGAVLQCLNYDFVESFRVDWNVTDERKLNINSSLVLFLVLTKS